MHFTRLMLTVAWVPLLSGCMAMGGMGHVGHPAGMHHAGREEGDQVHAPLQRAEASNSGLTIALSFPRPSSGVAVAIEAQLLRDSGPHELSDVTMWLRIQAPNGSVEELRLPPSLSSAAGTHRVEYAFANTGLYLVTAKAQVKTDGVARTVSVTTAAEVGSGPSSVARHRHASAALLGGLGVAAMMALMMTGSGS